MSRKRRNMYTDKEYTKDEKHFENVINGSTSLDPKVFKRLLMSDIVSTQIFDNEVRIGTYSFEDISKIISNPRAHRHQLLVINEEMKRLSPHYRRIVELYGNIPVLDWYIDLYDVTPESFDDSKKLDRLKKRYQKVESQVEKMNLKHEFSKVFKVIASQDVYYGLVNEGDTEFFFQKLNPSMCEIYEVQDGVYNFKINLNQISELELEKYPDYIQQAYSEWRSGKGFYQYAPDPDKQVCIKFDESTVVTMPPLLNVVKDLFDLEKYKKLKYIAAKSDNYKAIVTEVPFSNDKTDKPMVSIDTIELFAEMNRDAVDDSVGLIHTVGNTKAVSFKDNTNTQNNVEDCTNDFYNSAGIDSAIFNGSTSGSGMKLALEQNGAYIYAVYRQIERWVNRYLKFKGLSDKSIKFAITILDSTVFNRTDVSKKYAEAIQYGAPVKRAYIASLGVTPSKANCAALLENTLLDWNNTWIPVHSSFTQPNDSQGTNEQADVVDVEGERTREKV